MNIFNSVKTRQVSRKNHSPITYEIIYNPDGSLSRNVLDNKPTEGFAEDFSISNQLKSGVKFDAPQGDFFKPTILDSSDIVLSSAGALENVPEPLTEPLTESPTEPLTESTTES